MKRTTHGLMIGFLVVIFSTANVNGQDKSSSGTKRAVSQSAKSKIPIVRVTPRLSVNELPNLATRTKMPINRDLRIPPPPPPLSDDARTNLLRDSGVSVTIPNSPDNFRLSPRQPYASSVAYLLFSGEVEFNASSDSLVCSVEESISIPAPRFPGFPDWTWSSGGPQPDPPAVVGVLMRMQEAAQYLADFSVSSDGGNTYQVTVTGADGTGSFPREGGGQHIVVALQSSRTGYVRINLSSGRTFTFHNVVLTRIR